MRKNQHIFCVPIIHAHLGRHALYGSRWHGPLQSPDILGCQGGKARASACCGGEIYGFTIRL